MLHCLRIIAENSSGPPEKFCEIVFISSMMSSLVILMSDSVFACGCPKKSFGYKSDLFIYLIVIVGSGVLKTLLYCSFSSSLIFLLLGSKFRIVPVQIAKRHLLEHDFHGFHRLLFLFASQKLESSGLL